MLRPRHIATIIGMLAVLAAAVVTRKRSTALAFASIGVCLVYILYYWAESAINRVSGTSKPKNDECLAGTTKKTDGLLAGGCIDVWHLYHLLFWILIGLLSPNRLFLFGSVSVIWEILEHFYFKSENAMFGTENRCTGSFCGRAEDIVINIIGYLIGSTVAATLKS